MTLVPEQRLVTFGRRDGHPPNMVVHGDNLDIASSLPDEVFDVIYVDPPFGTGTTRQSRNDAGRRLAWSDHSRDPEAFAGWFAPRAEHFRRTLAATGSLFVHLDYRFTHYVKVALDRIFGLGNFVNEIVWCYSVGGKSLRSFARKHDTILWYSKSKDYAFYPDAVRIPRRTGSHMRLVTDEDGELVQEKTDRKTGKVYRYPISKGKVPEDWWSDIETLNRSDAERVGWPTQKPTRLIERILRACSVPGDKVADFFCGSGTTASVAQATERLFLTTDISGDAVQCAAERLTTEGRQPTDRHSPPPDIWVGSPRPTPAEITAWARHNGRLPRSTRAQS